MLELLILKSKKAPAGPRPINARSRTLGPRADHFGEFGAAALAACVTRSILECTLEWQTCHVPKVSSCAKSDPAYSVLRFERQCGLLRISMTESESFERALRQQRKRATFAHFEYVVVRSNAAVRDFPLAVKRFECRVGCCTHFSIFTSSL